LQQRMIVMEHDLLRLVGSPRPDWGYPMLVGMARLLALEASVSVRSLVLLDTFSEAADTLPVADLSSYEEALGMLLAERHDDFRAARRAFFDDEDLSEARLSRLETAGNLFAELARATRRHVPLRVHADRLVPNKAAHCSGWPYPALTAAALKTAIAAARARERMYSEALHDLYGYNLFRRNCATELLRTLASAVADGAAPRGSRNEPDGLLSFIPFVAVRSVGHTYHVVATSEQLSYRRLALDESYAHENALTVYLREANVLTSRIYHRNKEDPIFLLFTDDVLLARPLYGMINLATSVAAGVAGLVLLPADSGALLRAGLSGAVFSLPELAFVSIRKGSFPIAPRRWLSEDQAAGDTAGLDLIEDTRKERS